jgi:pantoate--beta-alanine ligase
MAIRVVRTVSALRGAVNRWRAAGERIALVPTMGALHGGHFALVRAARRRARRVIVSIFVNPAQFAPNEDFASYPRSFDADLAALADMAVDFVWAPAVADMYPPGFATRIVPEGAATVGLEDKFRPHFFSGVATVVAKLLIQCAPDFAVFGEKDYQQLKVVTRLAKDLDLPVKIIAVATVREQDGLALSSRNSYLSASVRRQDRARRAPGARPRRGGRRHRARRLRARLSRSPPRRYARADRLGQERPDPTSGRRADRHDAADRQSRGLIEPAGCCLRGRGLTARPQMYSEYTFCRSGALQ